MDILMMDKIKSANNATILVKHVTRLMIIAQHVIQPC